MANAIKKISVQRGYDVHRVLPDGVRRGRGAARLRHRRHARHDDLPDPSDGLAALGLWHGPRRYPRHPHPGDRGGALAREPAGGGGDARRASASAALAEVEAQGVPERRIRLRQTLHLKVKGTDTALPDRASTTSPRMRAAFAGGAPRALRLRPRRGGAGHRSGAGRGGGRGGRPDRDARSRRPSAPEDGLRDRADRAGVPRRRLGRARRFVRREALRPGDRLTGPAVLVEPHTSILIEPGWRARITAHDHVELTRVAPPPAAATRSARRADPVMLEVFNNLYMSIAEQMGAVLENTAASVTIKERLDFSCAVFDARGRPDRQRPAHAGASRLDGREREGDHRPEPGHGAGRRLRAERPLQRRHAPARHHRRHAGLGRRRRARCSSTPPPAATTPTSAG